jgi:hypothetical protein
MKKSNKMRETRQTSVKWKHTKLDDELAILPLFSTAVLQACK